MALSNWDTLAVDINGNPISGELVSPCGVSLSIYKNWLYVRDAQAWRKCQYIEPTIMEINHGELDYIDMHIEATRGPQQGVFVAAWFTVDNVKSAMVGCGVYGYEGDDFVGVSFESIEFLREWLGRTDEYMGQSFRVMDDDIASVPLDGARRCNQGDSFFQKKLSLPDQSTPVGGQQATILSRSLES